MSKATKQGLALLSVIQGGIRAARDCFTAGPEISALMAQADEAVTEVLIWWPISGDELDHQRWVADRLAGWETELAAMPAGWSILANVSISVTLLTDLYDRVSAPEKRQRLHGLFAPLMALHDWIRPRWDGFDDYEFAEQCAGKLYRLIGFRPNSKG